MFPNCLLKSPPGKNKAVNKAIADIFVGSCHLQESTKSSNIPSKNARNVRLCFPEKPLPTTSNRGVIRLPNSPPTPFLIIEHQAYPGLFIPVWN